MLNVVNLVFAFNVPLFFSLSYFFSLYANLSPLCFLQSSNRINSYLLFHRQSDTVCVSICADSTDMLKSTFCTVLSYTLCLCLCICLTSTHTQTNSGSQTFTTNDMHISVAILAEYMCTRVCNTSRYGHFN